MNRKRFHHVWLLVCILGLCVKYTQAQVTIRGRLIDTANYQPMAYAVVSLIRHSDSILLAYQYTKPSGEFSLAISDTGKIRILISRASFADYEDLLNLSAMDTAVDIGSIVMISKANLLKEVIIRERSNAIRIRGDTIEYLVDSFLTNRNASVEDLMKRLPGLSVDKDGKITAQGQEVKRVLVDGEEFFGNDPTMATRNIRAEDVEKIQVLDQKSEQANLTGIDDGETIKTINLQLKEEAKKGYFGKAGGAVGTNERYDAEAMANSFSQQRKVAGYIITNNTNKSGLDWEDNETYGGQNDMEYDEESGYYYSFFDESQSLERVGVPQTWNGGIHYSDKKGGDKHRYGFNASRQFQKATGFDNNFTQYILPDTLYYNNQLRNVTNTRDRISFNGNYQFKSDSFNTFMLKLNSTYTELQSESRLVSENRNETNNLVNANTRINDNASQSLNILAEALWQHRFRTKGRSFSVKVTYKHIDAQSDNLLKSTLDYYDSSQNIISTNALNQLQQNSDIQHGFTTTTTYTEPLSDKHFLIADYQLRTTADNAQRIVNADNQGEYNLFVDTLSNQFKYDIMVNKGGLAWRYVTKKLTTSLGGKASYTSMSQLNIDTRQPFNQYFFNFFPTASVDYKIKNTTRLNVRYNGSTDQPTVNQIQPLQDISNPLLIRVGNPYLRQSFTNRLSVSYNSYKPITGRSIYLNASVSQVFDDFSSSEVVDANGVRTIQTVNTDGNYSIWAWSGYWFRVKESNFRMNVNVSPEFYRNSNFINGVENINRSGNIGLGYGLSYEIEDKLFCSADAQWTFYTNRSSLRSDIITNYWISSYSIDAQYTITERLSIGSDCVFNIRQQTEDFSRNLNTTIWNANISYRFLPTQKLVLSLECYDILNQNIGFERQNNSNFVNEHVYTVLQRYLLLRLVWNFPSKNHETNE